MTDLNKPVRRRGRLPYRGRRIIVTLEPGDMLGFRLERTRRTEYLTLAGCYERAVLIRVAHERAEKRKAKLAKKGN
jgi:hypothetical protein